MQEDVLLLEHDQFFWTRMSQSEFSSGGADGKTKIISYGVWRNLAVTKLQLLCRLIPGVAACKDNVCESQMNTHFEVLLRH